MSSKSKIIKLRKEGKTYNEIVSLLGVSKSTVSYHCSKLGLNGDVTGVKNISKDENKILEIKEYYKSHTTEDTALNFGISTTSVKRYVDKKRIVLTDDERRQKNYFKVKNRRQEIKRKAVEYKGGKCEKCGYNNCIWAFEFHHIDPEEKDFSIAQNLTLSWDRVKKELDKCIMVCANCHREIHYEEYVE